MKITLERVVSAYDTSGQRTVWSGGVTEADGRAADHIADHGGDIGGTEFEQSISWFQVPSGSYACSFGHRGRATGGRAFQAHVTFLIAESQMRELQFDPFPLFDQLQPMVGRHEALNPDLSPVQLEVEPVSGPSDAPTAPEWLGALLELVAVERPVVVASRDPLGGRGRLRELFAWLPPQLRGQISFSTCRNRGFDPALRLVFCPLRDRSNFSPAEADIRSWDADAPLQPVTELGQRFIKLLQDDVAREAMAWLTTRPESAPGQAGNRASLFKGWLDAVELVREFEQWRRSPDSADALTLVNALPPELREALLERHGYQDFAVRALPTMTSLAQAQALIRLVTLRVALSKVLRAEPGRGFNHLAQLLSRESRDAGNQFVKELESFLQDDRPLLEGLMKQLPPPPLPPPEPKRPVPQAAVSPRDPAAGVSTNQPRSSRSHAGSASYEGRLAGAEGRATPTDWERGQDRETEQDIGEHGPRRGSGCDRRRVLIWLLLFALGLAAGFCLGVWVEQRRSARVNEGSSHSGKDASRYREEQGRSALGDKPSDRPQPSDAPRPVTLEISLDMQAGVVPSYRIWVEVRERTTAPDRAEWRTLFGPADSAGSTNFTHVFRNQAGADLRRLEARVVLQKQGTANWWACDLQLAGDQLTPTNKYQPLSPR